MTVLDLSYNQAFSNINFFLQKKYVNARVYFTENITV